jgi:putative ATP-dependent endonuclease of OLD family
LFDPMRVRKRCAIITDLDASIIDIRLKESEPARTRNFRLKSKRSQEVGEARAQRLDEFAQSNPWVSVHYAPHTFEVEFLDAGNREILARTVDSVYTSKTTRKTAKAELKSADSTTARWRALQLAEYEGKGWFAILLGESLDEQVKIPAYILDALSFAHPNVSDKMWATILEYRLGYITESDSYDAETRAEYRAELDEFLTGKRTFRDIASTTAALFPNDSIVDLMDRY